MTGSEAILHSEEGVTFQVGLQEWKILPLPLPSSAHFRRDQAEGKVRAQVHQHDNENDKKGNNKHDTFQTRHLPYGNDLVPFI